MKKEQEEHRLYNRNFADACKNAVNGIGYSIKSQRNIRIQLVGYYHNYYRLYR